MEQAMHKAIDWFLWGLFMGMGWIVGSNVITFHRQLHAPLR